MHSPHLHHIVTFTSLLEALSICTFCSLNIDCAFTISSLNGIFSSLYLQDKVTLNSLCKILSSLYINYMLTMYSLCIYHMFSAYSLFFLIWSLYAHCICIFDCHYKFTIFSLYVYHVSTICSLYIHFHFTIC